MRFRGRAANPRRLLGLLSGALGGAAGAVPADPQQTADVRRALTLLNVVGEEYREGVADGVSCAGGVRRGADVPRRSRIAPEEGAGWPIAPLHLGRSRRSCSRRGQACRSTAVRTSDRRSCAPDLAATGVTEEVFPPAPPSASRGSRCSPRTACRVTGRTPTERAGRGRSEAAAGELHRPEFMRAETPFDFFHIISVGKGNVGHAGLGGRVLAAGALGPGRLSVDGARRHRRSRRRAGRLPGPLRRLSRADGRRKRRLQRLACSSRCRSSTTPQPWRARATRDLFAAVAHGVPGTPMPGFARTLSEDAALGGGGLPAPPVARRRRRAPRRRRPAARRGALPGRCACSPKSTGRRFAAARRSSDDTSDGERDPPRSGRRAKRRGLELPAGLGGRAELGGAARRRSARQCGRDSRLPRSQSWRRRRRQAIEARFPRRRGRRAAKTDALARDSPPARRCRLPPIAMATRARCIMVSDAYFEFEPLEKRLAAHRPGHHAAGGGAFVSLRGADGAPGNGERVAALVAEIGADLDAARCGAGADGEALEPRRPVGDHHPARGLRDRPHHRGAARLRDEVGQRRACGARFCSARPPASSPACSPPTCWRAVRGVGRRGGGSRRSDHAARRRGALLRQLLADLEGRGRQVAALHPGEGEDRARPRAAAWPWRAPPSSPCTARASRRSLFYNALLASAPGDLGAVVGGFAVGLVALAFVY